MQGEAGETECLPIGRGATVDGISHRKFQEFLSGRVLCLGRSMVDIVATSLRQGEKQQEERQKPLRAGRARQGRTRARKESNRSAYISPASA